MMRTRLLGSALATVLVGLVPASASAGGWDSLTFRRDHYLVGEVATASQEFFAGALNGSGPIDGRAYYAYLLPMRVSRHGFGMIDAPTIPTGSIRLGVLGVSGPFDRDGYRYARASLSFTVPNVPTGDYAIGFCDDPCEHGYVGWLAFARIRIVHTEREAKLMSELDRREIEDYRTSLELRRSERNVDALRAELSETRAHLRLEDAGAITPSERIVTIPAEALAIERPVWPVAVVLILAFGLGLLAGAIGARRIPAGRSRVAAVRWPAPVLEPETTVEPDHEPAHDREAVPANAR